MGGLTTVTYNPYMYYIPGNSGYMSTNARYYRTLYFKVLLDPATLKPVHGHISTTVADQIKDYMDDSDKKAKATKQFSMADRQFYGFYDRDAQAYSIAEIIIYK